MNREDIIRMAQEAGFELDCCSLEWHQRIARFAALVAAAERESMIKQGWRQCAKDQRTTQFCGMVEQAIQAEREACVQIVENEAWQYASPVWAFEIVNDIRARGQA
jgi:hypothetical protein